MHRHTIAQYHRVVNMVERDHDKVRMNKMAAAMANSSNTHDFFTESGKRKGLNNNLSKTIHNVSNYTDIGKLYGKIYDKLYNSVLYKNKILTT